LTLKESKLIDAEDTMTLSEELVKNYQKNGIIKIKLPPDVIALKDEFLSDCCMFLKHWTNFDTTPGRLPYDKKDRAIIGKLYKASKRFRASRQLSSHPYFINIVKQLMNTTLVSCFHLTIVRIDIPYEEKFLMPAHQDFPYIQGSVNGITIFLGFHDLIPNHGIASYQKGSHTNGVIKVTEGTTRLNTAENISNKEKLSDKIQTPEKVCEIADLSKIDNNSFYQENLSYDEGIVFHTLLLHRSEKNTSNSARITLQLRFDDLTNEDSFNRNFPEGRGRDDLFVFNFPEFVVEKTSNHD